MVAEYDRSQHEASCPCIKCIAYDVQFAKQERPNITTEFWTKILEMDRNRKLNWDLPVGHCILCGGTETCVWQLNEHFLIKRFNEKESNGQWLSSLMMHKQGSQIGAYKTVLKRLNEKAHVAGQLGIGRVKSGRDQLLEWACNMMDLQLEKCKGFASREHDDWVELRLAFTEIIPETFLERTERRQREGKDRYFDSYSDFTASKVQGTESVARSPEPVLSPMLVGIPHA